MNLRSFFLLPILCLLVLGGPGCVVPPSRPSPPRSEVGYQPEINPDYFVSEITNPFFNLTPGATFVYEGETEEGTERVEVTVLPETRTVMGVVAIVVHDQVFLDDELIEDTYDQYAQDREGNVWYFGEDSKEIEDEEVVSAAGSWEAGVDGALPGIAMQADPQIGQEYRQEYYAGEAEDMGEIVALSETVDIGLGTYSGCLKTRDWTPLEAQVDEYKWYCPEVGFLVLEEGIYSGDRVELVETKE